jgi:carbamoyltransferase
MTADRYYVGVASTMHDSAIAILDPTGSPAFAESTERYLQCKRAYNCPADDLIRIPRLIHEYCSPEADLIVGCSWSDAHLSRLDAFSRQPFQQRPAEQEVIDQLSWPLPDPRLLALSLRNSISQGSLNIAASRQIPNRVTVRRYDHHLTHAANAAFTSGFDECAVAVVDGFGETAATAFYRYRDGELKAVEAPAQERAASSTAAASLGMFYSRLCALCGFDPLRGEEWKVMGLAPYGGFDADLYSLLRPMVRSKGLAISAGYSDDELVKVMRTLRATMRPAGSSPLLAADLAFTGQTVFEEIMCELLCSLHDVTGSDNLAMGGGCALNSTWNGKVRAATPFSALHVPCAPADDGNALGAALVAWAADHQGNPPSPALRSPFLGSSMSPETMSRVLAYGGFHRVTHAPGTVHERAADLLAGGAIIGWIGGRAEFGPRALGNRSILADPRDPHMVKRINELVKFREQFRPFAPAILHEYGPSYFEDYQCSLYMERTLRFRPEVVASVPAVVHVNGTGRLQSVERDSSPRLYQLIESFRARTGVPIVLNTSLNVMDRPIAHTVEDVIALFCTTGLDAIVIEDTIIEKDQPGQPA